MISIFFPERQAPRYSIFFIVSIVFISCGQRDEELTDIEKKDPSLTSAYQENDTMALRNLPANIRDWISYYHQYDQGFELINFKASGVVLHLDTMNNASAPANELLFGSLLAYSPDSSRLIDFWSYLRTIETDDQGNKVMSGGGPDQEVILGDRKKYRFKQLMYNGTQQVVETADWIDNDSFILGLINANETGLIWIPEIFLFNLQDSSFTNFRLNHEIQVDSMLLKNVDFSQYWLNQRQIRME